MSLKTDERRIEEQQTMDEREGNGGDLTQPLLGWSNAD
jgi:hypothetical protein